MTRIGEMDEYKRYSTYRFTSCTFKISTSYIKFFTKHRNSKFTNTYICYKIRHQKNHIYNSTILNIKYNDLGL